MLFLIFFFFNDTATTEIYTLSLHDALPISLGLLPPSDPARGVVVTETVALLHRAQRSEEARALGEAALLDRSEEHTSELQSQFHLVCRLLLEKKNNNPTQDVSNTSVYSTPL